MPNLLTQPSITPTAPSHHRRVSSREEQESSTLHGKPPAAKWRGLLGLFRQQQQRDRLAEAIAVYPMRLPFSLFTCLLTIIL